jgi:hypothetical protein
MQARMRACVESLGLAEAETLFLRFRELLCTHYAATSLRSDSTAFSSLS